MQLVGILTAAFLLSSCSSVLSNPVHPQGEVMEGFLEVGSWKRYKVDGEEELFKFLGFEVYYPYVKDVDVYIKSEITDGRDLVETYTRGTYKVVTTLSAPNYDQITMDSGDGKPLKLNIKDTIDDEGNFTYESDGVTHISKRVYQGTNEFKTTTTYKIGDETHVSVDYFRKVA